MLKLVWERWKKVPELKNVKVSSLGRVKINGETWTAVNENESEIISPDELVNIIKVDGVKLIVKKVD